MNTFEVAARHRKVLVLVGAIDSLARKSLRDRRARAADPHDPVVALAVLKTIRAWSPDQWARLAICAGVFPPSDATIVFVEAAYRKRAGLPALVVVGRETIDTSGEELA